MKAGLSVTEYQCVPGLAWGAGYVRVVTLIVLLIVFSLVTSPAECRLPIGSLDVCLKLELCSTVCSLFSVGASFMFACSVDGF